ncbi:MAG: phytoene/squalene synthase family protein [Xenococcaceae cyanobacterium MO_234.B1]|nr:phytoene/squalene synthase family protein [Xenococcaceae cyanobacterium MO_234.B1]
MFIDFRSNALEILRQTSRTFYIPISILPKQLRDAVASAYLCMRAIDEIEDHDLLDNQTKAKLLQQISLNLQSQVYKGNKNNFAHSLQPYSDILPEVTLRIGEWSTLPSETIAPRIWDATAAMADRMAYWAEVNWNIETLADLDSYTFSVAGAVGLLLSDIWAWYDGTVTNRSYAIGFGRGLQAVNIIRNRADDLSRGADFFPDGWQIRDMQEYARSQLQLGQLYTDALPKSPALDFCRIPLALAFATLDAIALGKEKLSRSEVLSVVSNFQQKIIAS